MFINLWYIFFHPSGMMKLRSNMNTTVTAQSLIRWERSKANQFQHHMKRFRDFVRNWLFIKF